MCDVCALSQDASLSQDTCALASRAAHIANSHVLIFAYWPTLTRYALRVWAKLLAEEAGPSSGGDGSGSAEQVRATRIESVSTMTLGVTASFCTVDALGEYGLCFQNLNNPNSRNSGADSVRPHNTRTGCGHTARLITFCAGRVSAHRCRDRGGK